MRFAQERAADPDGLVLVGWSMGGLAAAGLSIHASTLNIVVAHTICLAGAFMARDPISGEDLGGALTTAVVGSPFTLLHGLDDDVVPPTASRTFADELDRAGWQVELVELATDHGAIAGARYDSGADRYAPAHDAATLAVAGDVAARIAAVAAR